MKKGFATAIPLLVILIANIGYEAYAEESSPFVLPGFELLDAGMRSYTNYSEVFFKDADSDHSLRAGGEAACEGGTRTTWSGTKVCAKFCGMDNNDDCHMLEYAESISKEALAGIVLAVLSLVALPVFICVRCVCNGFGGRKRSKGVCCCVKRDAFMGYTRRETWIVKGLLFASMIAICACCIVGFASNSKTDQGINDFTTTLINTSDTVIGRVQKIGFQLEELPYTKDVGQTISDAVDSANELLDSVKDVKVQVDQYNQYRAIALIVSFAIPVVLIVVGSLGAVFNFSKIVLIAALFCFFSSFILWLSFGIHNLAHVVFTDVCLEVDGFLDSNSNSSNAALDSLISCTDGGSFSEIKTLATDAIETAYQTACDSLQQICSDPNADCPSDYSGSDCSRENIEAFADMNITDYLVGCNTSPGVCPYTGSCATADQNLCYDEKISIKDCAENCMNSDLKSNSNATMFNMDALFQYEDIIKNDILPLLDCTIIKEAFESLKVSLCVTFTRSLKMIANSSVVCGVFLIPGTILLILGFKRFRKDNPDPSKVHNKNEENGGGDDDNNDIPLHKHNENEAAVSRP